MSTFLTILAAIIIFGVIILIHELGHFITARIFGVTVNEFAIGMGPVIYKKQGKNTLYSIRAVPMGGFAPWKQRMRKATVRGPLLIKSRGRG